MDIKKRSGLWLHFSYNLDINKAKCRYCGSLIRVAGGSTSNLSRHMKSRHPTIPLSRDGAIPKPILRARATLKQASTSLTLPTPEKDVEVGDILATEVSHSKSSTATAVSDGSPSSVPFNFKLPSSLSQSSVSSFVDIIKPMPINKSHLIDIQIVKMICREFHPFSLVEDPEFIKLLQMLNPAYKLPTRKTISHSLLPNLFNDTRSLVQLKMNCAVAVYLTADGWTSTTNVSYLAVTAHYLSINPKLSLSSALLSCSQFTEKHTAQNISDWLLKTTKEWEIHNKVSAVVTDNAPNIVAAVRQSNWRHIPCFAHSLNLVVQAGLQEIGEVISKVKAVVQFFKQSAQATAKLEEMQKKMGFPQLKLKQDILTRWNSTFDMLSRFFKNRDCIVSTLALLGLDEKFQISNREWVIIQNSIYILLIFNEVTQEMSAEKSVTISKVSILSTIIIRKLNNAKDSTPELAKMKTTLLREMTARLGGLEGHPLFAQAILLDPRFKKQGFTNGDKYKEACRALKEKLKSVANISTAPPSTTHDSVRTAPSTSKSFLWDEFDESVQKLTGDSNPMAASIIEFDKYMAEPLLSRHLDPLHWWSERQAIYPLLYQLMLRRLCLSATSVPCERVFSKAGYTLNDKRTRLKSSKLSMIMFLNKNLQ